MGVDEGSLGEIRTALSGITRRLDALAGLLGAMGGGVEPAGVVLDEAMRARLARLQHLLATGRAMPRTASLLLVVHRALEYGMADAAAVLAPLAGGELRALAEHGFGEPIRLEPGAGIAGRALLAHEIVQAAPDHGGADALLRARGIVHAVALPLVDGAGAGTGVLLVGRRRPAPFDARCLRPLLLLAERAAAVLAAAPEPVGAPASGEAAPPGSPGQGAWFADLDLQRTAESIAAEVARCLGASAAAVLVPSGEALELAGGIGLPPGARPPPLETAAIRTALASRRIWSGAGNGGATGLEVCLGPDGGLVVPLVADESVVAVVAVAGPRVDPGALSPALLARAALGLRNARLHAEALAALAELRRARPPGGADQARRPPHEFASLLAVVLGRLAAARERATDPGAARDLAIAEEAAWRAAEAVRGLLGYAPGSEPGRLEPVDLAAIVRERVATATGRWAEGPDTCPPVRLDVASVPPVRGNADDLRDVVDHLLENAREATAGAEPIVVRLRWDGGGRVELVVEDRGAGMDEATRVRAPDAFFTTKGPGRLGLGLAVVQAVALRHHGTLEVTSGAGQGTAVRLTLPSAGRTVERPIPARGRARVLVVEDEPSVRETLVQALAAEGHLVRGAGDGEAALAALAEEPAEVVVTDLALPGLSGLEVARAARRAEPRTAVLLITAWPGQVDRLQLGRHGVDLVLEKPVGLPELCLAIQEVLARRAADRR